MDLSIFCVCVKPGERKKWSHFEKDPDYILRFWKNPLAEVSNLQLFFLAKNIFITYPNSILTVLLQHLIPVLKTNSMCIVQKSRVP